MATQSAGWSRRSFLGAAAAALTLPACLTDFTVPSGDPLVLARPTDPLDPPPTGISPLGLGSPRDGFLYVPIGADLTQRLPLLVLLHGAGDGSAFWTGPAFQLERLANERQLLIMAPDSRSVSWDVVVQRTFGADLQFINQALERTFALCRVDPARIGLAGFSDGATTALSLGLPNGGLFSQLAAFSPGFVAEGKRVGKPRIFVSHGVRDPVFPIASTGRPIVTKLRQAGYNVEFQEFDGTHLVPVDKLVRVMDRLVAGA